MRKTAKFAPYTGNKTNLIFCKNRSGVYLVYEGEKIVYVGFSSNHLYRTITRHFQQWNDTQQKRYIFDRSKCKIRVVLCTSKQAMKLEEALILKHKPKYNKQKLSLFSISERSSAIDAENKAEIVKWQELKALPDPF